jgi:selenobiotic family peptide radical SAM maturase
VNLSPLDTVEKIFSTCRRALGSKTWGRVMAAMDEELTTESFLDRLAPLIESMNLPGYITDLAKLEWILHQKKAAVYDPNRPIQTVTVNPTLTMVPVCWKNLEVFIRSNATGATPLNEPAHIIIWRHPKYRKLHFREARDVDLLALKLIVEQIDPKEAAKLGKVTPGEIQTAIDRAISHGFLLSPGSRICRAQPPAGKMDPSLAPFLSTDIFALQWHVTQACNLHCKHCYDRSERTPMALETAMALLDVFYDFCRRMHVRGQVTFTGGNPLLYPHFEDVYRAASQFGFGIAILGNPTPLDRIQQLLEIAHPKLC